jgi:hypothetical protein
MRFDVRLPGDLPLEAELRHRQRAVRALEVATALEEGVPRFLAVESFELGAGDRVIAGETRVSWGHWLVTDRPEAFIPALPHPAQRPIYDEGDADGETDH